jgi:RimJ/RimL family protein N-acetyltransferase
MEIGFTLNHPEHGKGYAQEALSALIHSLFKLGSINKILSSPTPGMNPLFVFSKGWR